MAATLHRIQAALCCALVAGFATSRASSPAFNGQPIIGVLAQEDGDVTANQSFIPASYVKALEAAGARVAPIFIGGGDSYYRSRLAYMNGVVFPGGGVNFKDKGGYGEAAGKIYRIAKEINERGGGEQVFPVLGVCQGLEVLAFWAAGGGVDPLVECRGEKLNLALEFKPKYKQSRLYRHLSPQLDELLSQKPVTVNHHHLCLTEGRMRELGLDADWRVLSTNADADGLRFVSSLEHRTLPFTGVQFHPEKPAYEWSPLQGNPHGYGTILANRYFYDWLANAAKMNGHRFPDETTERESLIYNYPAAYTPHRYDLQYYFFAASASG